MTKDLVLPLVRHALSMVAGGMAVKYGIDASTLEALISGAVAAVSVGWALWDKRQEEVRILKAVSAMPVPGVMQEPPK